MAYLHPHGHVFYRGLHQPHPLIVRGEGVYLYDDKGKRYLDACGGALVVNIGHSVPEIAHALSNQAGQIAYVHAPKFTNAPMEAYAQALAQVAPLPDARVFPVLSGSEATEAAIKLARQVQRDRGETGRYKVISRWGSYHGATLGALSASGRPPLRRLYTPLLLDFPHIPPPYCYRCRFGATYPNCDLACAHALETEILRQGPENVAAFIAEPVVGATLGAVVPPPGYWLLIREICDRYGVLLIADEVMTGFGRTGQWFGIQHWDVTPDVITAGKGASNGYFPLAPVLVRGELVNAIAKTSGSFIHGCTFSHHAVGAAVGLAVLRYLQDHDLITAANARGERLGHKLRAAFEGMPCVGEVRGIGMMWAVEFVTDRESKQPFPPQVHLAHEIGDAARRKGVIVYTSSGCADGVTGDLIMVAPPFTITEDEMDDAVRLLQEAVLNFRKAPGQARKS
ncbi:MAG TPA: aminotransferase class III-fold pyridoxal phosphate-dependent enzyme [Anaerolineae bacterium]|nr:aminotransferase class III-fold pyridoxal phosphate-dependent enzyme [Anaerolineae bacterium]